MTDDAENPAADALREEALAWLIRVEAEDATPEDWAALTDWLAAVPAHLEAYEAVEALSAEIDANAAGLREIATRGNVVAFAPRRPRRVWMPAAAAAAAALFILPVAWRGYQGVPVVYQTGQGETREVALTDGTQIRLDARSRMTVRLGWGARRVKLDGAQAAFDVAHDPRRPFLIDVGDQQVKVVGTAFNIRQDDRQVVVTVRRGVVEVRQPDLGPQPVARLVRGQELRHQVGAAKSVQASVDPDAAFGWTMGRLVCDDRPLTEIVADLNRRYATPIALSPRAARMRFSGVLDLADQDALVDRLAKYLALNVDRGGGKITLR